MAVRLAILIFIQLFLITSCGGGGSTVVSNDSEQEPPIIAPGDDDSIDEVEVFKPNSPFVGVIANCIKAASIEESCTLNTLPVLGLVIDNPTVTDVMNRVVVSNEWMGIRFEEILNQLPGEILPLFKGITAVVIDDDIRPAYYTTRTGAIYLDPAYLWLSVEEKQTINNKEDPRSGFSDPLQFRSLWRYVDNGERLSFVGSLDDDSTRELEDIIKSFAQLLLHELAHANDFVPQSGYDALDRRLQISAAINAIADNRISHRLTATSALTSPAMYSLGEVMFRGGTPSESDLVLSATEVGEAFEQDAASDDYAYSSLYEDTAMLFEEAMMKYFFDIDRDVGYTVAPEGETCESYVVKWGVRNRLGDSNVKPRALYVSEEIFPQLEFSLFFQEFPLPTNMRIDQDWCSSIDFSPENNPSIPQKPSNRSIRPNEFIRPYL